MKRLLVVLLLAASFSAYAGGTSFACRYLSLKDQGNGMFVLTLQAIGEPGEAVTYAGDRDLVLHLRYSARAPLPSGNPPVARSDFDTALARIRRDLARGELTRFGILGSGLVPINGQPGQYRVFGLRLEDERDPANPQAPLVVYAY